MKISVVGLGKLGSPIVAVLASKGHSVIGLDLNKNYVDLINKGIAPVEEPNLQNLLSKWNENISATATYDDAILNSDITLVIVPTPSGKDGSFINDYIIDSMKEIGASLTKKNSYHLVVIKSTVMPGSTSGPIKLALEEASNKLVGFEIGLCYSPEFIALGSVVYNLLNPDIILIGESDSKAGDILEDLYDTVCDNKPTVKRMNFVNAEISKISINTYVTTKISYANMLSDLCQRLEGADVDVVTSTVGSDTRVGMKYIKAGLAFGGPCFPRDNIAFATLAKNLGANAELAIATQNINRYQNSRLIQLIETHNDSKKISILGLSYKPGTPVIEESQAVLLIRELIEKKYEVFAYDPMANNEVKKVLANDVHICENLDECIAMSDFVIVMTPWPFFSVDISGDKTRGKKIVDCWRILNSCSESCELIYLGCGTNKETVRI
jgi:UDPglucose 6-dehydrogenase